MGDSNHPSLTPHTVHTMSASQIVQPTDKIDWKSLSFGLTPTNGYVKYTWKNGAWGEAEIVKEPYVQLHVASVALNYGQSCFEGLKAYRHKDGSVRLFRPQENAKRMNHSGSKVCMPKLPEAVFLDGCRKCTQINLEFVPPYGPNGSAGSMYLRPLYFGSGGNLALGPPDEFTFLVWATPAGSLYGKASTSSPGVDAFVLEDFDRTAPKGTGDAKLAGNYAPVFGPMIAAKKAGYPITLHLDSATRSMVDEFSTSNCLMLSYSSKGSDEQQQLSSATLSVPESPSILKSVTTKSIAQIAEKTFGWTVKIAPVPFADVKAGKFDEMAAAGTAAVITPVRSVSYHADSNSIEKIKIGNGETAGPGFIKAMTELTGIQSGDVEDTFGWMWPKEGVQPL